MPLSGPARFPQSTVENAVGLLEARGSIFASAENAMSNRTAAAEWAKEIVDGLRGHAANDISLALDKPKAVAVILDAYARQQVGAFREQAAHLIEMFEQEVTKKVSIAELEDILSRTDQPSVQLLPSGEVSIKEKPLTLHALAAAIRALSL